LFALRPDLLSLTRPLPTSRARDVGDGWAPTLDWRCETLLLPEQVQTARVKHRDQRSYTNGL